MVWEWLREKNQPPRGYPPHPERWQVSDWEQQRSGSLLSLANPSRYVRDVEVDTDSEKVPASTSPPRLRADDEPRGARAPRKRKWDGDADLSQREVPTAPVRRRTNNELARPKQKARKLVLPADSSAFGGSA
ncbi:hypothetical protein AXG93_3052s1190 [Marchantia polymorpha subsp. ruderalis]|uniref:Uncharacterized protein n=1 Tax=Marchantia polymorpha subsp. ruderalis TaxID=1480154 RepID=A0A176WIL3_MARPO|nr:hypothetical protein AXG93_3052s1190 [Marchantia polymorpha subsp. ruderalis]